MGPKRGGQTRWCPACDETEGRETSGMGRERGESRARGVGREKLCSHGVSGTLVRALEPAAGRPRLLAAAKLVGRTRRDSGRAGEEDGCCPQAAAWPQKRGRR